MRFEPVDRCEVRGRGTVYVGLSPNDDLKLGDHIEMAEAKFVVAGLERRGSGPIRKGDPVGLLLKPEAA